MLRQLSAARVPVGDMEWLTGRCRAVLHRAAHSQGFALPAPPTRTPDRAGWCALIVEHGLDVPALAVATGLRRDYVRDLLVKHGLLETWWGRRGRRYAEWTMGDEGE